MANLTPKQFINCTAGTNSNFRNNQPENVVLKLGSGGSGVYDPGTMRSMGLIVGIQIWLKLL